MQSDGLRALIRDYNWDDGFFLPQAILNDPACDLALALEIFYLADGYALLNGNAEDCALTDWTAFICPLFENITKGRYLETGAAFAVPLNRTARYRFRKQGVPEVFLTDLPRVKIEKESL